MNKVIINKDDLCHNIKRIKEHASKSGKDDNGNLVKIIAVVKGNGYGLGLVEYANFLIDNGISMLAVATTDEAMELRNSGIKEDILMLSSTAIEEEIELLVNNNIIITIGSKEDIEIAEKIGKNQNKKIKAHLKIDTGFGRFGFIYSKTDEIVQELKRIKNINIEGTFSHFSISFFDEKYTKMQFDRFIDAVGILRLNKIETGILHICNSSAFIKYPNMHLNAVRIGSAFLGRMPFENSLGLKRIAHLESEVCEIKELPKGFNIGYSNSYKTKNDTTIAVIHAGYMNGVNVQNNKDMFRLIDKLRYVVTDLKDFFRKKDMYVTINKEKCKILGTIGTYHIVCDITNKNINIGDKVEISINPRFVDSSLRREYR